MKKRFRMTFCLIHIMIVVLMLSSRMIVTANNTALVTEHFDSGKSWFDIQFSADEATGMIQFFDVSETGRIATCIGPSHINVYDEHGLFDYCIDTNTTRTRISLQWDGDILLIYLDSSGSWGSDYGLVRVEGYAQYACFSCPDDERTKAFWSGLEQHEDELIRDNGRYYVKYGNLRFADDATGADYALTENTSFRPWWLLSIPVLTAVIWFGFLRKRVKAWERQRQN